MEIKVEKGLEAPALNINVLIKDEVEDEMTLIKREDSDLVHNHYNSVSSDDGLEPDPHAHLLAYLKLVGSSQNIDDGENIVYDGKIFNPTPVVKKYKYHKEHSCDERYLSCGVNRYDNHWCRFYRKNDPQCGIGYRYLNCDKSVFYHNPDHSEYYVDAKMEWFRPPPEGINWETED